MRVRLSPKKEAEKKKKRAVEEESFIATNQAPVRAELRDSMRSPCLRCGPLSGSDARLAGAATALCERSVGMQQAAPAPAFRHFQAYV